MGQNFACFKLIVKVLRGSEKYESSGKTTSEGTLKLCDEVPFSHVQAHFSIIYDTLIIPFTIIYH